MEHHFGAVDETTKRLVGRCVRVPWLMDNDHATPEPAEERGRDAKVTTTRKLLGAEIPAGMASSLSVVEVTTQKERPGVRTGGGSRQRQNEDQETHDPLRKKRSQTNYDDDNHGEGVTTTIQEKSPFEVEGEA